MLYRVRRDRAFTLVELMVVIVLMGGVTAMGLVMYSRGNRGDKMAAFSRALVNVAHQTRQTAVASGLQTRLRLNPATTQMQLTAESQDPNDPTAWVPIAGTISIPAGADFCVTSASPQLTVATPSCPLTAAANICFMPNAQVSVTTTATCPGAAPRTGATIFYRTRDDAKHYKLVLWGLTGLPRLMDRW